MYCFSVDGASVGAFRLGDPVDFLEDPGLFSKMDCFTKPYRFGCHFAPRCATLWRAIMLVAALLEILASESTT